MCGCKQWSTDINESNYNMQPITIEFAVRVRKDYTHAPCMFIWAKFGVLSRPGSNPFYPALPVYFGADIKSHRSLLSGVYGQGKSNIPPVLTGTCNHHPL